MKNLSIRRIIAATFTADQWGLFDQPGRNEAAADLNRTLTEAVNADGATPDTVRAAMTPVCGKHSELGADDGEANYLIERVIELTFDD